MDFDWRAIVRSVAPTIASYFGTPLAGMAVKYLADNWLGEPDATEDEVSKFVVGADAGKLAELRKIDADFKTKMAEIGLSGFKAEIEDKASARGMRVALKDHFSDGLAVAVVVATFGILYWFLNHAVPPDMRDTVMLVTGYILSEFKNIYGFYFGTSRGSQEKTAIIGQLLKNGGGDTK